MHRVLLLLFFMKKALLLNQCYAFMAELEWVQHPL